ncbi:MAG TPA: peroxiredoxin [Microthrixaceae bacterium]|nr:peroxiredoxin [Microthrixaceae bacterium]
MSINVGDTAPDFTLRDDQNEEVTLSSFRGEKSVTLVFIPFAFTAVCQGELCDLRDNLASFQRADNVLLAITCNTRHSLAAWKAQEGFTFPLLSDFWPHGAVATAYGCFNDQLGCAMRQTVVIDKQGVIVDVFASGGLGEARDAASYTAALEKV